MSATASAFATDVGVSVSVGQPGFYGRIDVGSAPPPRLVYAEPILIRPAPVGVVREPIYLRVPPGHAKHWAKHCYRYNACGQPVYFVQDSWYSDVYVPYHRRNVYVAAEPAPAPVYAYRPPVRERLYSVPVASVRAVVGPPEQRCWVERQQVVEERNDAINVPGAIVGAVVGGVLGHQVGGGRGKDLATAGGAVAGAAIGANVGRGGTQVYSQDVQRCASVESHAQPEYWDVTYRFRGVVHRAQMSAPPGRTIVVNESGEPRG
ncbi:MAG TPA: glycine zipper 2TM domain-containing protein [Casimicrobiaceae bacterium]